MAFDWSGYLNLAKKLASEANTSAHQEAQLLFYYPFGLLFSFQPGEKALAGKRRAFYSYNK